MTDRYFKQILLAEIGEEGQKRLNGASAVIAGCGGLGTVIASSLVRFGVGKVTIVDRDFIELDNLARQVLFDEEDIRRGLPKAIAAAERLMLINSEITVEPVVADLTAENIERIIKDTDIVLDGTDNFETRFLINDACVKLGIPWIYGGVVATYGMSFTIIPGTTPCLKCFITELPGPGSTPTCDTVGVLGTAVNTVASIEVTEALKILLGKQDALIRKLIYVDVWYGTWNLFELKKDEKRCPVCDDRQFAFLEKKKGTRLASLCGQNAVQISPPAATGVLFKELASRLASSGKVSYNDYMLRFTIEPYEFTVFPDGRTIIKGTMDESMAKTLFSKYIGV
ncbi:MAG TPA: ThiF family adenylyltransferase [Syntrophales bacterium]|nr:ThiF family adenylyltransferase [Syntrophales bacterium]